jgi:hypothetical protein
MSNRVFRGENPSFFAYQEGKLQPKAYPSGSISTTPNLEKAIHYAKQSDKYEYGYVYIIDLKLCEKHQVVIDKQPSAQDELDAEVILRPANGAQLPLEVIVEIRRTPSLMVEYNFCGYYNEDTHT